MNTHKNIVLGVVISEKSNMNFESSNAIILKVRKEATKLQIKNEINKFMGVQPLSVRTANVQGKIKRHGQTSGRQKSWKKAFVKFSPGTDISQFSATE